MNKKRYNSVDELIEEMSHMTTDEVIARARAEYDGGPRLITRDMLIAAGALNVKREKPKAKTEAPRPLFGELDDEEVSDEQEECWKNVRSSEATDDN